MAKPWRVRYLCCGYEHHEPDTFETWERADEMRRSFEENAGGHERVGIIERTEDHADEC